MGPTSSFYSADLLAFGGCPHPWFPTFKVFFFMVRLKGFGKSCSWLALNCGVMREIWRGAMAHIKAKAHVYFSRVFFERRAPSVVMWQNELDCFKTYYVYI